MRSGASGGVHIRRSGRWRPCLTAPELRCTATKTATKPCRMDAVAVAPGLFVFGIGQRAGHPALRSWPAPHERRCVPCIPVAEPPRPMSRIMRRSAQHITAGNRRDQTLQRQASRSTVLGSAYSSPHGVHLAHTQARRSFTLADAGFRSSRTWPRLLMQPPAPPGSWPPRWWHVTFRSSGQWEVRP
jgi:hypothetical protein